MYSHTQHGKFHYLLFLFAVVVVSCAFIPEPEEAFVPFLLLGLGAVFAFLGLCFGYLRIEDDGDALEVRFGPLPVFGKRLRYDDMRAVREARSRFIDGWGVHWVPGRGWTYNLWGFACVEIELSRKRRLRLGSDDARRLLTFLSQRIEPPSPS